MREFLPHQKQVHKQVVGSKGSGCLFLEMRLGKTMVAIRSIERAFQAQACNGLFFGRVLVVCPVEGIWAWKRELSMEKKEYYVIKGTPSQKDFFLYAKQRASGFFIINFEGLKSVREKLRHQRWDAIVVDESRRMANPKNVSTKILRSLPRTPGQVRQVLSGEPAPESPLEYFEQVKFVWGSFMGCDNYWQFRSAFFKEFAPHDWDFKTKQVKVRFKEFLHQKSIFMTRKEAGLKDRKIYEVRTARLPKKLRRKYNEIKEEFLTTIEGKTFETKWLPVQYQWLHQLSSGWLGGEMYWEGKTKLLVELLKGELRNQSVVVWFKFNSPLRHVRKVLASEGIKASEVFGEHKREERERQINNFRGGRTNVLLAQIKCAKTAIDLSTSSTAVYFTNSPSLEERKQSEDRILNPLKFEPLLYLDLITEDTVEENILELLKSKKKDSAFYWNKFLIEKLKQGVRT